jgi:peptidyl-prolyl cis-trans isomerase C
MKKLSCLLFILVIFSLIGCENLNITSPAKPEGTIVAQVGNMYITLEQLNQEIDNINTLNALYNNAEPKKFTPEEKLAFLKEELIPRYLFYKEAKARNVDKDRKVQEQLLNAEVRIVFDQFVKKETTETAPTSKEIEAFYNSYKERFRPTEERRIREILVSSEDEAKEVLIELLKGTDFATLAQQRSKAQTASKGGDLGFIGKGQLGEEYKKFDEMAFSPSLEQGQISSVFKDKKGYYIIRLDGVRGGQTPSLNEVWDQVKSTVTMVKQQQKIQELNDSLSKKTKVAIYQEKVK